MKYEKIDGVVQGFQYLGESNLYELVDAIDLLEEIAKQSSDRTALQGHLLPKELTALAVKLQEVREKLHVELHEHAMALLGAVNSPYAVPLYSLS